MLAGNARYRTQRSHPGYECGQWSRVQALDKWTDVEERARAVRRNEEERRVRTGVRHVEGGEGASSAANNALASVSNAAAS